MGKTAFTYYLHGEGDVLDDTKQTVFECTRWQNYCSVLTLIIGTIMAANIVEVKIASREN